MVPYTSRRRKYLKTVGAIGATAGFAGCLGSGSGNGKPDSLTLGTWGGSFQDLMIEAAVKPFEEETGIDVNFVLGTDDRFSKLQVQKDKPPVDISQQDTNSLVQGENQDLWHDLNSDLVPIYSDIPDNFKTGKWVTMIFAASSLLYNTRNYDSPPKDMGEYLNADEGRVAMALPSQRGPEWDLMAFSLYRTNGESQTNMEEAWDMYEQILKEKNPIFSGSAEKYGQLFDNDEVDIARFWSSRASQWNSGDKGVNYTLPESGAMMTSYGNAIPKNIPDNKLEWAGKLINYTLRAEAAMKTAEALRYTSPNPNVEYPDEIADQLITGDDLEDIITPDFNWIAENKGDLVEKATNLVQEYN